VKAQSTIREMNDRMRAIIDASADAIISVDEDERIVVFNIAAEKLFQLPAAEALGQTIDRFIPARFRGSHRVHVRNFSQYGATLRAMGQFTRLTALRADGSEFPIEAAISHASAGGRDLFTVTIRDITQRKAAEAAQASL
jgi:PAS domain S-box-containing protein